VNALVYGLMAAQAMALSAAPLLVLAGGIIGQQLHSDPRFSTLPVAAMICGTALFAWPAARLATRLGRRSLFLLAMLAGVLISLAAAFSVASASFWGFTLAALGIGAVNAVVQQFRFVAMALVPAADQPLVASRLLLAGLVSAFLGPELTRVLDFFPEQGFAPAFAAQAFLYLLAFALLLLMLPKRAAVQQGSEAGGRSWGELLQQSFRLPLPLRRLAMG
jgi:MFS family permease